MPFQCPHCDRVTKSDRGLTQHMNKSKVCKAKQKSLLGSGDYVLRTTNVEGQRDPPGSPEFGFRRQSKRIKANREEDTDGGDESPDAECMEAPETIDCVMDLDVGYDDDMEELQDSVAESTDSEAKTANVVSGLPKLPPNTQMLADF